MSGDKHSSPERDRTDESLRTERETTDRALAERQANVEREADSAIERARHDSDAVLTAAREETDQLLGHGARGIAARDGIAQERATEDTALREERLSVDHYLRAEREENARILAALLPLEREKTDRFLLTERSRSDEALSVRDDFLGIVSHDLRNLLGGIAMSVDLIGRRVAGTDDSQTVLAETARIQRYVARMNRLVGDLVDVASMDAGKLAISPESGDFATLVDEAVHLFQGPAATRGVSMEVDVVERPLPAIFDRGRMLQVLANLISNASKFTPPGGGVSVRGERVDGELRCSISDTGPGIAEDMLDAVFERFWQVGTNDRRGVGLGLYISRCIVEAHGGRIWATSTPGEGSTFSFTLPAPAPRDESAGSTGSRSSI